MVVLNDGTTFFRRIGWREITPDVSFISETIAGKTRNWKVIDVNENCSHYYYISFSVEQCVDKRTRYVRNTPK